MRTRVPARAASAALGCAAALWGGLAAAQTAPPATPARDAASAAYRELAARAYDQAIADARRAVDLDPGKLDYWRLLIEACAQADRVADALEAARKAEARFGGLDAGLHADLGFAAVRGGDRRAAADQFARALSVGGLDAASERLVRLSLFDARQALGRWPEALESLEPLRSETSFAVQSRLGEGFLHAGRLEDASEAFRLAALSAPDAASKGYLVRARIQALLQLGKTRDAEEVFRLADRESLFAADNPADVAELAVRLQHDAVAQTYFAQAARRGRLSPATELDAAYSAKRLGRADVAERWFLTALTDSSESGRLTPQQVEAVRAELATVSRLWGAIGYFGYARGAPATVALQPLRGRGVSQAGGEVYWLLPQIAPQHRLAVFARTFATVQAESGAPTGAATQQGYLGVRIAPFVDENLIVEADRLIKIGRLSRDDWMLRAAISRTEGLDYLQFGHARPMWSAYGDVAYLTGARETLGVVELRAGGAFAVPGDPKGTATVYGVFVSQYDDGLRRPSASGLGIGIGWRQFFRETNWAAPRSYLDASIQYRAKLGRDDRASGAAVTLSLSY